MVIWYFAISKTIWGWHETLGWPSLNETIKWRQKSIVGNFEKQKFVVIRSSQTTLKQFKIKHTRDSLTSLCRKKALSTFSTVFFLLHFQFLEFSKASTCIDRKASPKATKIIRAVVREFLICSVGEKSLGFSSSHTLKKENFWLEEFLFKCKKNSSKTAKNLG